MIYYRIGQETEEKLSTRNSPSGKTKWIFNRRTHIFLPCQSFVKLKSPSRHLEMTYIPFDILCDWQFMSSTTNSSICPLWGLFIVECGMCGSSKWRWNDHIRICIVNISSHFSCSIPFLRIKWANIYSVHFICATIYQLYYIYIMYVY